MPRAVTIHPTPNPTGLNMAERQLAISILQSVRAAVVSERKNQQVWWGRHRVREYSAEHEQEVWERVLRSAMNQFSGRQKTENGLFQLKYDAEVHDKDMQYVLQSLGIEKSDD